MAKISEKYFLLYNLCSILLLNIKLIKNIFLGCGSLRIASNCFFVVLYLVIMSKFNLVVRQVI